MFDLHPNSTLTTLHVVANTHTHNRLQTRTILTYRNPNNHNFQALSIADFPEPLAPGCAADAAAALAAALDLGWPVLSPPRAAASPSASPNASLLDALADDSAAGVEAEAGGESRGGGGGGGGGSGGSGSGGGGLRGALLYQRLRGDVNAVLLQGCRLDGALTQLLHAAAHRLALLFLKKGYLMHTLKRKQTLSDQITFVQSSCQ
jgi:hypothetical protein